MKAEYQMHAYDADGHVVRQWNPNGGNDVDGNLSGNAAIMSGGQKIIYSIDYRFRNCAAQETKDTVVSEMSGGVKNAYIHDCTMDSPTLTRLLELNSNGHRGGGIEDVHATRIRTGVVDKALLQIWLQYEKGDGGPFVPAVARVSVSDTTVGHADRVLVVRGRADSPVRGLVLSNITVAEESKPSVVVDATDVEVDNVVVGGKRWSRATLEALPGLDSITCDKWAVCR